MKIKELRVKDKVYSNNNKIEKELFSGGFNWLIDAEIEEAIIEIKNNTIVWHDGIWYMGVWEYGIWKNGEFRSGKWRNGIFESGIFKGNFESGKVIDGNVNEESIKNTIFRKNKK